MTTPTTNGNNGRDENGRFAIGNPGGPGNPYARRVAELRSALLDAITPDAIRYVMLRMIKMAVEGDVAAAKLVLERAVGKPLPDPMPEGDRVIHVVYLDEEDRDL